MPQNTPMKRQFTTIDGRTVMSNLPQHWGGNDWAITGVDNPLPVGNYVQTEAGVWIPQKGSDDGAADVRLTGSNVELFDGNQVGVEIPAGTTYFFPVQTDVNFNKIAGGVRFGVVVEKIYIVLSPLNSESREVAERLSVEYINGTRTSFEFNLPTRGFTLRIENEGTKSIILDSFNVKGVY